MAPFDAPEGIAARVDGDTLVVTIGTDATVDLTAARQVNRGFMHALAERDVDACLTVLDCDDALTSDAFTEIERAAAASISHGIARWAVAVDDPDAGATFADHVPGIETRLFEDEATALEWTNDA